VNLVLVVGSGGARFGLRAFVFMPGTFRRRCFLRNRVSSLAETPPETPPPAAPRTQSPRRPRLHPELGGFQLFQTFRVTRESRRRRFGVKRVRRGFFATTLPKRVSFLFRCVGIETGCFVSFRSGFNPVSLVSGSLLGDTRGRPSLRLPTPRPPLHRPIPTVALTQRPERGHVRGLEPELEVRGAANETKRVSLSDHVYEHSVRLIGPPQCAWIWERQHVPALHAPECHALKHGLAERR
jgi:hypothetical protein